MMKAYPAYKELSLDFLDSVPMHWDIAKLKFLSSVNFSNVDKHIFEDEIPVLLCNYVDVYKNDFIKPDMQFMKATATEVEISKFTLCQGDVLITKDSESWDDIAIPAFVTENMDGVLCGYHLAKIRPASIDGKFLFWALCSSTLNDQYKVEAHGITRYGLGKDSIENSFIPVPTLPEQQAIADFLDRKTAQIDTLIEKKQRQIDLLQEQRTALINHAVTKGLNPDVPTKDSGVEWFGATPSNWQVMQIRRLVTDHKQGFYTNEGYVDEGTKLLRITDIDDNSNVDYANCPLVDISENEKESFGLEIGDFVFARSGSIGRFGIIREKANVVFASYLIRFRFSDKVIPEFIKYYFLSYYFRQALISDLHGGANQNIHAENIKNQFITLPPIPEQTELVTKLDKVLAPIAEEIEKIKKEMELIIEYRTALISEAVTGKIDVREWKT